MISQPKDAIPAKILTAFVVTATPTFSKEALIQSQERSARGFVPNWGLEIAGILYVFQDFQTEKLGQKTRWAPLPIYSVVP